MLKKLTGSQGTGTMNVGKHFQKIMKSKDKKYKRNLSNDVKDIHIYNDLKVKHYSEYSRFISHVIDHLKMKK